MRCFCCYVITIENRFWCPVTLALVQLEILTVIGMGSSQLSVRYPRSSLCEIFVRSSLWSAWGPHCYLYGILTMKYLYAILTMICMGSSLHSPTWKLRLIHHRRSLLPQKPITLHLHLSKKKHYNTLFITNIYGKRFTVIHRRFQGIYVFPIWSIRRIRHSEFGNNRHFPSIFNTCFSLLIVLKQNKTDPVFVHLEDDILLSGCRHPEINYFGMSSYYVDDVVIQR